MKSYFFTDPKNEHKRDFERLEMEEYYGRITTWRDRGALRGHDLGA